ncbi:hypothetical protein L6452_34443 [Arctium lappa]|uniref:Uncharacterized protein n=1 Tax=Arctium lappa TaxID=4217 RepID=A0ACB8YIC6_ARCLA|nr:hypothetical protein L6452_34443 [Arctium lappa]
MGLASVGLAMGVVVDSGIAFVDIIGMVHSLYFTKRSQVELSEYEVVQNCPLELFLCLVLRSGSEMWAFYECALRRSYLVVLSCSDKVSER